MIINKLKEYLDKEGVKYVAMNHPPAYTAQEIAHLVHVPGKEMAKTVMISIEGKTAMAVLPASYNINFSHLCGELNTNNIYLESEEEFRQSFPDCELGAMPPFGNLYDMKVIVAKSLAEDEEIVFNAGTHTDLIKMSYKDFARLVSPDEIAFSVSQEKNPGHIVQV